MIVSDAPLPLLVAVLAATLGCSSDEAPASPTTDAGPPPCAEVAGPFSPLSTRCGHFVDREGRVVMFRGINARVRGAFDADLGAGKVPLMPPIPEVGEADFARMRQIGFDLLRLPINWSAIEPEDVDPPRYDAAYLDRVAAVVAAAKKQGVMVLVDLHQDAYSKWIGQDGAPLWAIVPPPEKVLEGPLDDLADRRLSKQVTAAFSTFFSRTSKDGPRLRARFAAAVAKVAERLRDDDSGAAPGGDNVLAIELFNEPQATDAELRAFDEEVGAAVRKADPKRLIAFEPPVTRNFTDSSLVTDTPLSFGGTIYAPHVYTNVFATGCDGACRNSFSLETLRRSNENARDEADGWKAPLLIGEIGFFPDSPRFADWVALQYQLQDEYLASSAWWVWKENSEGSWGLFDWNASSDSWSERPKVRKAFARPQPRAISGWPRRVQWDATTKRFEIVLRGDPAVTAPNIVHLPLAEDLPATWKATCDGKLVTATPDARGDLSIACGGAGEHRILVEGT